MNIDNFLIYDLAEPHPQNRNISTTQRECFFIENPVGHRPTGSGRADVSVFRFCWRVCEAFPSLRERTLWLSKTSSDSEQLLFQPPDLLFRWRTASIHQSQTWHICDWCLIQEEEVAEGEELWREVCTVGALQLLPTKIFNLSGKIEEIISTIDSCFFFKSSHSRGSSFSSLNFLIVCFQLANFVTTLQLIFVSSPQFNSTHSVLASSDSQVSNIRPGGQKWSAKSFCMAHGSFENVYFIITQQ